MNLSIKKGWTIAIGIMIFLSISINGVSQQIIQPPIEDKGSSIKNENDTDKLNRQASKSAWKLINTDWKLVTSSVNSDEWYIYKNYDSKSGDFIKVPIMVYFPKYTINNTEYIDVVIKELVMFDIKEDSYKVNEAIYYKDFIKPLDIFNNTEGDMIPIKLNSVLAVVENEIRKTFFNEDK